MLLCSGGAESSGLLISTMACADWLKGTFRVRSRIAQKWYRCRNELMRSRNKLSRHHLQDKAEFPQSLSLGMRRLIPGPNPTRP